MEVSVSLSVLVHTGFCFSDSASGVWVGRETKSMVSCSSIVASSFMLLLG